MKAQKGYKLPETYLVETAAYVLLPSMAEW